MVRWQQVTWRRWCVKTGILIAGASLMYLVYILPTHSSHMKWPTPEQWKLFGILFGAGFAIYCVGYTWDGPYNQL
jgi:hypothetical protein